MNNIEQALKYYQANEPHLKSQLLDKIERLEQITNYSMGGLSKDYAAQVSEGTADIRKAPENYTTNHIKEHHDEVIAAAKSEYKDKVDELNAEHNALKNEIIGLLQDSITVRELNNEINSGDMLVLQNKLKSELNQINLDGQNGANQLREHFDANIRLSKHDKQHGLTLSALLHMYDDKLNEVDDNQYLKHSFKNFIKG